MEQLQSPTPNSPNPNRLRSNVMQTPELEAFREKLAADLITIRGRIRKVKIEKGFGFIAGDDGIDYFFHWTAVQKSSPRIFRALEDRDRVSFSPIKPPNKDWRAIEVSYVAEEKQ